MASVITVVVILVLAAGAAASPTIGMPGCVTTCGGVEVSYPFGIGPDPSCFLHQPGFNLTCDHSHDPPRLLLVSGTGTGGKDQYLRVQYIYDSSLSVVHTVDLSTTGSDDITLRGPFMLSKGNELVLTGCNVQSLLLLQKRKRSRDNGTEPMTISGCYSFCNAAGQDDSVQACSGAGGCCRAPILVDDSPAAAGLYGVELNWFGRKLSADRARAPARAFIAKEGWFDYWLSNYSNSITDTTTLDAPVFLDYEISGNCSKNPCKSNHSLCNDDITTISYVCTCDSGYSGNAYVPGGCQVDDQCKQPQDITGCYGECTNHIGGSAECRCPSGTHGNYAIPGGCLDSTLTHSENCTRDCGDVEVPYPFGIQDMGPAGCFHPGFNLTCDRTHDPPRLLLGDNGKYRVEKIHLENATVHAVYPGAFLKDLSTHGMTFIFSVDGGFPRPGEAPYSLSPHNELVLTGCDVHAAMLGHHNGNNPNILSGCVSFCTLDFDEGFEVGNMNRRGQVGRRSPNDKYCHGMGCCQTHISQDSMGGMPKQLTVSWLVKKSDFVEKTSPVSLFIAAKGWFDELGFSGVLGTDNQPPARATQEVPIILNWEVLSSKPNCATSGNICKSKNSYCKQGDRGYTCHCKDGYDGNPYADDGQGCKEPSAGRNKTMITVISIGVGLASATGLLFSVLIGRYISNKVKHRRAQMLKRKFFEQNRGQLLQQLVSQRADIAEKMIIPLEELEKATNNFDKTRELGGGGHGIVYKGILSDLHVVAIKKPKKVLQREIDEFINEVAILSQINHKNVVKLYGCCLETEVPMLVYEFISNGTLYDHLHNVGPRSLSWEHRLRIAIETAKSLAYLHSAASVPIIHRDVKSVNILLDDTLTAKVADFGASRYISVEKSGLTTMVQGTIGYLDPMYFYTGRLTEKSDVYSYGVMLVELLTRKKPFLYLSSEGEGLVVHFVTLFEEGNLSEILDPQVTDEGGKEVKEAIALAVACIKLRGEERPTMRQVELTLEGLRPTKEHSLNDGLEKDGTVTNSPSAIYERGNKGSTRQYSMEAELTMSSRYPR